MPKQRISGEMVVDAAFELAREKGLEQITVTDIAGKLGCSVQPVYSYCRSMDGLRRETVERARRFVKDYLAENTDRDDLFRSTGMAFIKLAETEPHIFRMFVLSDRGELHSLKDVYESEANPAVAGLISDTMGLDEAAAQSLHMDMLIYTVGMGTILATAGDGFDMEGVYSRLENAYEAFCTKYAGLKEGDDEDKNEKNSQ